MPHVSDATLNQMLQQLPPDTRKSLAHIVSGKITHQVHCLGEDSYVTADEPVLDKDGNPKLNEDGTPKTKSVRQLAREGCKGAVIAYLYVDGTTPDGRPQFRVEPALVDGAMKLRSTRKRLDGQLGFQCRCGNDSRLARQESGHIKYDGLPPSREGLEAIYRQVQLDPANYPEIEGVKEVDGFQIERVAV